MAAGPKCPLPPPPWDPLPLWDPPLQLDPPWLDHPVAKPPLWPVPPKDSMTGGGQGGPGRIDEQGRIDNITDAAKDFALQLPSTASRLENRVELTDVSTCGQNLGTNCSWDSGVQHHRPGSLFKQLARIGPGSQLFARCPTETHYLKLSSPTLQENATPEISAPRLQKNNEPRGH